MKLTTFLILLGLLNVNANTFGQQRISLSQKNKSLIEIFKEIKKQSDYNFVYNSKIIGLNEKFSINLENASIQEALDTFLKNSAYTYEIINKTIVVKEKENIPDKLYQNKIDIKGRVTDKEGLPLIGVVIKSKQSQKGTTSLGDGSFELKNIDADDKIIISYLGFLSQELPATSNSLSNVILLNDVKSMEEIVVVGYGTQKKLNLTGAISNISGEEIGTRPTSNIANSLQGLLPGLNIQANNGNPGEKPDINVRGFNSINGGSPLILIDGIQGDIDRVNPLDVESVTVLKDAASAAIYGARGAFGVILITTKKGKSGKLAVNYSNNVGYTTPVTRTDFISDPYLYGKTIDAAIFGYNGTNYTGFTSENDWQRLQQVANGELEPFREKNPDGTYKFFYNTNWFSYLFKKWQPTQNHNISISGGNDKIQGYLSGRVYNASTIQNIVDADIKKYNIKGNLSFKVNDWLQISDNIQVSTNNQIEYGGGKNGYGGIWSNTTWYNLFPFLPNKIDGIPFDYFGSGAHGALEKANNYIRSYSEQFINTASTVITPVKGLVINADYSTTVNHIANSTRLNNYTYLTTNKIISQVGGLNRLTENRNRDYYNALNIYGTYTTTVKKDHNFKLLLGYNQENFESDNVLGEQEGLLVSNLSSLNLGTGLLRATGNGDLWGIRGYFGRFNYDYKSRYLLEINSRYDGSSRFPSISRWGFFPSVSVGWYVSNEKFYEPLKDIASSLKLRLSYGKLGNQNIDLYTFSQILSTGQTSWLSNNGKLNYVAAPSPLPSVVSWEDSKTIDFGFDMGFLQDRLTASFDWYEKNISGMYLPGAPLPGVFGAPEPKENIASLRNRGFEFALSYHGKFEVKGSPLAFKATASIYNFEGVITKYPNPNGLMSTFWEGQKLGTIYGYKIDGQFQSDEEAKAYQAQFANPSTSLGQVYNYEINIVQNTQWKGLKAGDIKYLDLNKDGAINKGNNTLSDHGDLAEIGNAMPKFPFGFNINATWKSFDLGVAGAGVAKQDWYPTGDIYWGSYERPYLSFIRKDLVTNAWSPETPNNTYPQISRGYASLGNLRSLGEVNDYYLKNVGYLRVKNLTFGYTLPQKLTRKASIERLRFYFSGENIFTIRFGDLTKYIDPEMAGSGINYSSPGSAVSRSRVEDYPMGKTYSFGLNLTL